MLVKYSFCLQLAGELSLIEKWICPFQSSEYGRLSDRSKETPKTMKQIGRLFPNKVTIQLPQVIEFLLYFYFILYLEAGPDCF